MKRSTKLFLITGFISLSVFGSANKLFCDDEPQVISEEAKLNYLELRGLNYDYVHFYKQSEDHKNKEEYLKSQENALQYKKKLNSYLLKSPNIKSLQDPNGYFSSDQSLGFNPLNEKAVNSLFKSKPYILENGTHYFASKQENKSNQMDIQDPKAIDEVSGFSDEDFNIDFDENEFAFDQNGFPIDSGESFSPNEVQGLSASRQMDEGQEMDKSVDSFSALAGTPQEENAPPLSKNPRFNHGIKKLTIGTKKLQVATKHLHLAMKKYKDYINSDNVHPDKVTFMRDKLQMHISKLHRVNGILSGYGQSLSQVGTKFNLDDGGQLKDLHQQQIINAVTTISY